MHREPTDDRKRGGTWIFGVVLLLLAFYMGGYFMLAARSSPSIASADPTLLLFDNIWMAQIYRPAVWVEAKLYRKAITVFHVDRSSSSPVTDYQYAPDP